MIIKKLKLQNWKNFRDVTVELTERVFVVGPNASGKSNLLDGVRFLRDIVKKGGGFQSALESRGGLSKIRCFSAGKGAEVALETHLAEGEDQPVEWIYRLSFNDDALSVSEDEKILPTGRGIEPLPEVIITEERVWHRKEGRWILERTPDAGEEDSETIKSTHLEQPSSNRRFREISHFFRDVEYLHVIPQLVRDADSYPVKNNREDYYGKAFLQKIADTPEKERKARLKIMGQVLHALIPWFDGIEILDDPEGEPHLEIAYDLHRMTRHLRESQFSDGTLRILGLMWALLDGKETLLLEEPEMHLHTMVIRQLPEMISILRHRHPKARQVMITTHSFDLLGNEGIGGDEVILLQPGKEATAIQRADLVEEVRRYLTAGFSMAEAVIPETSPRGIEEMLDISGESR